MNSLLAKANIKIRSLIPPNEMEPCSGYFRNGFLHMSIASAGCRFRNAGYCSMCDYGRGKTASKADVIHFMERVWREISDPVHEVLVGSCGSFFDHCEISEGVRDAVLRFLSAHPTPSVIFETHYTTVTADNLTHVKNVLAGSAGEITIEMGLESAEPYILENSINKFMDLSALHATIKLVKSFDMSVVLNVLLGAPFLTPALQLADAEQAIRWALDNGADGVVVFPANIKNGALTGYLNNIGRYDRQNAWLLVELLSRVSYSMSGKIELSWYGDRQKQGIEKNALPPYACEKCDDSLQEFFTAYNNMRSNAEARQNLIAELLSRTGMCDCFAHMKASLDQNDENAETLISRELTLLAQEFSVEGDW